jgi:hypothetical protein
MTIQSQQIEKKVNENDMEIEGEEYKLWSEFRFNEQMWCDTVVDFFKRALLDNPLLSFTEKKFK